MNYGSICSGVEAASVAWDPLGFKPVFFSQFDPDHDYSKGPDFASAVLRARFPNVPNLGDFTKIGNEYEGKIDILIGGTPCQAFSVSGHRKGLDDDRGNLTLEYIRLAERLKPEWVIWENVPGVFSIDRGKAFASFLQGLGECGYGWAYRVLDAKYFGVPQQRRRVFVIGNRTSWNRAAAVLFEPECLQNALPELERWEDDLSGRSSPGASRSSKAGRELITYRLTGYKPHRVVEAKYSGTIFASIMSRDQWVVERDKEGTRVRRFSPLERERLQGFPDNWTDIPYRDKDTTDLRCFVMGNSMAVPVIRWLGERIKLVDDIVKQQERGK